MSTQRITRSASEKQRGELGNVDPIVETESECSGKNSDETIDAHAAAILLHCDVLQIEALARRGEIPGTKIGRGWIFLRTQLLAAIADKASLESAERRANHCAIRRVTLGGPPGEPDSPARLRGRPRKSAPRLPSLQEIRNQCPTRASEPDRIPADSHSA